MARSPFEVVLEAVLRALERAAAEAGPRSAAGDGRDGALEGSVCAAAGRAAGLCVPRDVQQALGAVIRQFEAPLGPEERRRAAGRGLARLSRFAEAGFAEAALARPASALPGVGPKRAAVLAKRGLGTVADLLFHLPSRYDDRRSLSRVGDLEVGTRATFVAPVLVADFSQRQGRGRFRGRIFEAVVGDDSGTVGLKWFRGGEAVSGVVRKDALLLVTGDVKRYRFNKEIVHPEIELLDAEGDAADAALRRVVPDYSSPDGVNARSLRRVVQGAVAEYADLVAPHLPEAFAEERRLPGPADALRALHDPPEGVDVERLRNRASGAHQRLILEELYLLELGLALRRSHRKQRHGFAFRCDGPRAESARDNLPFELTGAQRRAWRTLARDLSRAQPMNRLLQGDVGSGKTVVAYLAAVAAAESGYQTALMAPTELLAEQHARTLARLVEVGGRDALRLGLLTASTPEAHALRGRIEAGGIDLIVGTHALLQQDVRFRSLGLVVIDEQQRFGVRQRAALGAKAERGRVPHTLVMTATPIPRTLALTLYGDLDLVVIDEMPPGRTPVRTLLFRSGEGRRVTELLRETAERGEQAYVVYPLVEESEKSDLRSATESAERIQRAFPDVVVDIVHGQQPAAERAAAMERFERGETQVLVSTTVIEVGVDVPNATLMIIEHAERFGLAQLHQLRGRVGRGDRPGTCVCVARGATADSEARLRSLLETHDGFEIAEADLRIRGPGEFLGTRQSGHLPDLRIADLARDGRLLGAARDAAVASVGEDPGLAANPALLRAVRTRWGERLALAGVG